MSEGTANKTASLSQAPGLMLTSWAGRKSRRPITASPWKAQSQPVKSTLRYHQAATFQLDPCRVSSEKVHVCSSLDGPLHIPYAVNIGLSHQTLSAPRALLPNVYKALTLGALCSALLPARSGGCRMLHRYSFPHNSDFSVCNHFLLSEANEVTCRGSRCQLRLAPTVNLEGVICSLQETLPEAGVTDQHFLTIFTLWSPYKVTFV